MTGLANRDDYERNFGPLAHEWRLDFCGSAVLYQVLSEQGIRPRYPPAEVARFPPDALLPTELRDFFVDVNELVDATKTSILATREAGGERAEVYTVENRQWAGILMVAVGDTEASAVRRLAWTAGLDRWEWSDEALWAANKYGLSRRDYELLQMDLPNRFPAPDSERIEELTAGRAVDDEYGTPPWVSYQEAAELARETAPDAGQK